MGIVSSTTRYEFHSSLHHRSVSVPLWGSCLLRLNHRKAIKPNNKKFPSPYGDRVFYDRDGVHVYGLYLFCFRPPMGIVSSTTKFHELDKKLTEVSVPLWGSCLLRLGYLGGGANIAAKFPSPYGDRVFYDY